MTYSLMCLEIQWESITQLARLPSLTRLMLKGVLLPGDRGMDSREMIIAKMPSLVRLTLSPSFTFLPV